MRAALTLVVWLGAIAGSVGSVHGDIAYHFKPGIEGQVRGFVQFAEVARSMAPEFQSPVGWSFDGCHSQRRPDQRASLSR